MLYSVDLRLCEISRRLKETESLCCCLDFQGLKQSFDHKIIDGHGLLDLHTVIYDTEVSPVSGLSKMEAGIF